MRVIALTAPHARGQEGSSISSITVHNEDVETILDVEITIDVRGYAQMQNPTESGAEPLDFMYDKVRIEIERARARSTIISV